MTTITPTTPLVSAPTSVAGLRRLVRADAVLCAVSGAVLVVGAAPFADLAGLDPSWPAAAAGTFLLAVAAGLVLLARATTEVLLRLVPWSGEGDLAWALASVAVAVAVDLTGPGRAIIAAQGLLAVLVGVLKLHGAKAARAAG